MKTIDKCLIDKFGEYLMSEEKSEATVEKYLRDVRALAVWTEGREIKKTLIIEYKNKLTEIYAPASVNSMLSSLNRFFTYAGREDLKVRTIKIQRRIFANRERELTKKEYERLLYEAKKTSERLFCLMQTICSTGIRVSELRFITAEAVRSGEADICCKGKRRKVWLPKKLRQVLGEYIKIRGIKKGPVFITKNGKPLDRSNIWKAMKELSKKAGIEAKKVFPHNLRHLFARTYYSAQKDIVRLADILGHSSVNTTRIYTMESGDIHRRQIDMLNLLL